MHVDCLATVESYRQWGEDYGLDFVEFVELTENLEVHYGSVRFPCPFLFPDGGRHAAG